MIPIGKWFHPWRVQINRYRSFTFQGARYRYCMNSYNESWDNERTVEIPLFQKMAGEVKRQGGAVLEIGNVLAYYGPIDWQVVDKYETATHVTPCDIVDFSFQERYDFIFAISTIEHIGFDEEMRKFPEQWDESKLLAAIAKIVNEGLKGGGRFVVSFPLGYNIKLDNLLFSGQLGEQHSFFLKRISLSNRWCEVGKEAVLGARYNTPFYLGNAVCIAEFRSHQSL